MSKVVIFALIAICVVFTQFSISNAETQCAKERRRALVAVKKQLDNCQKSVSNAAENPGCLAKCILENEGILAPDNTVTMESFTEAAKKKATGQQLERVLKSYEDCIEEYGSKLDAEDETCSGYLGFGMCLKKGIENLCEGVTEKTEAAAAEAAAQETTDEDKDEL